mmetsp:Transcript_37345/g.101070  ORF Transcript_37345/g.101070 Transcript_37345/m.101070 type:complete len:85 (-) Transcript_37345:145-399(-)
MGQSSAIAGCTTIEQCSSLDDMNSKGTREQISTAPVELRERTYVTARADADTALPISVRSQLPTARISPRFDADFGAARGGRSF